MRLAIFYSANFLFDGKKYYTKPLYTYYQMPEISKHFDSTDLIVFSKFSKAITEDLEIVDTKNMNVIGLLNYRDRKSLITEAGWETGFIEFPSKLINIFRLFYQKKNTWDVILIWDPYVTNQFVFLLTKFFKKSAALFLGARYDKNVLLNLKGENYKRKVINHLKSISFRCMIPIMTQYLTTIVAGREIYELYKKRNNSIYKIFTSITEESCIDKGIIKLRDYKKKDIYVLNVCRITPEKGLEYLIEAIFLLSKKNINIYLDIIGPIASENYYLLLVNKIRELHIEDRVKFVGVINNRQELMKCYSNADIFALSSISEGTPKVIPEAMAKGLPIVATRVGGITEIIQDRVSGILVDTRNVQELAEALEILALDGELRRKLGQNSLEKAEGYTIENQMKKFADILKLTLKKK